MELSLINLDQVKALVRYRVEDPTRDAAEEVADYLSLSVDQAATLIKDTTSDAHEILGRDPTSPPEEHIYRNSPDYYLSLLKSPIELPHLWTRLQIALSLSVQSHVRSYIDYG